MRVMLLLLLFYFCRLDENIFAQNIINIFKGRHDCADIIETSSAENIIICDSIEWSRQEEDIEETQKKLKSKILVALSERISVRVKSSTTSNVTSQSKKDVQEVFSFDSEVSSSHQLAEILWDFCPSKPRKRIYAKCSLNREKASNAILNSCIASIKTLNSELSSTLSKGGASRSEPFEEKLSAIQRDYNSAIFLFPRLNSSEWDQALDKFYDLITELKNSSEGGELSQRIEQAQRFAINEKFPDAIRSYRSILQTNQINEVRISLLETEKKYFEYCKRESSLQIQLDNHLGSISIWKSFIQLCALPEALNFLKESESLRFMQVEREFKTAMQGNDDENIESKLSELKTLSHTQPDRYNEIIKDYKKYRIQKTEALVKLKLSLKKNSEAYELVKDAESNYGYSQRLSQLKVMVEEALVKEEIRREKKTRPMLNSFEIGMDGFLSETSNYTEIFSDDNVLNTGFSGGLYFRYRIKPSLLFKKRTRADIIGIRGRMIDLQNPISFQLSNDSIASRTPSDNFIIEVGPDIVLLNIFRINANAVYMNDLIVNKPAGLSVALGLVIPLGRLSIGADIRGFVGLDNSIKYNSNGYVKYRLDFNRKYSLTDKKAAKTRILG